MSELTVVAMTTAKQPSSRLSLDAGGRTRTLTVVGSPDSPEPRALVLVFHGSKQTGDVHRAFTGGALDALAAEGDAVVAYLDGHRGNWNDARRESRFPARRDEVDDVAFVRAAIDLLQGSHGVDPSRVVVVGFSNGGQFVLRLLHETPGLLAGAVAVAVTMPDADGFLDIEDRSARHRPPVAIVAGTRDRIIPFGGGRVSWWVTAVFEFGGGSLSARQTGEYLARRNGIRALPVTRMLPAGPGARGTRVEQVDHWEPGKAPVTLYVVHGGGHTVPGPRPSPRFLGRTAGDISVAGIVRDLLASAAQGTGASRSSSS
jgi:polyhydroxybutyrate depolymerase